MELFNSGLRDEADYLATIRTLKKHQSLYVLHTIPAS